MMETDKSTGSKNELFNEAASGSTMESEESMAKDIKNTMTKAQKSTGNENEAGKDTKTNTENVTEAKTVQNTKTKACTPIDMTAEVVKVTKTIVPKATDTWKPFFQSTLKAEKMAR